MSRRRGARLLLLTLVMLALPLEALADLRPASSDGDRPSHIPIPPSLNGGLDPLAQFDLQRSQALLHAGAQQLASDPAKLKQALDLLQKQSPQTKLDPNDPRLLEQLKKLNVPGLIGPDGHLTLPEGEIKEDAQRERLEKLLGDYIKQSEQSPAGPGPETGGDGSPAVPGSVPPSSPPPAVPPRAGPPAMPPADAGADSAPEGTFKWLAASLEKIGGKVLESTDLSKVVEGLNKTVESGPSWLNLDQTLDSEGGPVAWLGNKIGAEGWMGDENWAVPGHIGEWSANLSLPQGAPPSSGGDGENGWPIALAVFALALAAYAAYSLRGRLTRKGDGADGGHPPPWPVSPSNVATAAQLIQAFEHLALRTLGVVARPWHHARIAERLAAAAGDACHAQAVRRLSAAYEQARYAPAPLAEADLAAARADLCLVAGVSAA